MSALPRISDLHEHYLVSHGKSGGLGCFSLAEPHCFARGARVVLDGPRGREIGTILGPANVRQARLLGAVASGTIVRPLTETDQPTLSRLHELEDRLFEAGRQLARDQALPIEILDIDLLFQGPAIMQFVGEDDPRLDEFAQSLSRAFQIELRLENLALPKEESHEESQGCGKPDCGRTEGGGGGCSTCSTGGGCSSCGSGKVDLRDYFGQLRTKMENAQRTPLN